MQNMTKDRLHTNGVKALYPTFVNVGEKEAAKGSEVLMTITLKAKKDTTMSLEMKDAMIVDRNLNVIEL